MTEQKTDSRSASQKITDLENATLSLLQTTQNLVRDVMTLKETAKLLNNKTSSIAQAVVGGELPTDAVLTRIMVGNNVADLEKKTQELVASGTLAPQDTVGDNSFIVGSEIGDDGTTVSPRVQFALSNIKEGQADVAAKFTGAKAGDTIDFGPGKFKFQVNQIYSIQDPTSPDAPTAEAVDATAPATTAAATPDSAEAGSAPTTGDADSTTTYTATTPDPAPADTTATPAPAAQ
jgi:hypothetical protein